MSTHTRTPRSRADRMRPRLLRFAFETLYGPLSPLYDWVSGTFFMGQWRVWQRAAIPHLRGGRVLEVGMGTGNLQIDLRRAGFDAYGVDLSPQMLRRAARKARRLHLPPFKAVRARAQSLPFADEQFDSLVSTFPSEYIVDPATLSELHRVLRPGGRMVIVPSGWLYPRGARGRLLEALARLVYGQKASDAPPPAHGTLRPEDRSRVSALEARIRNAGFAVESRVVSNEFGAALVVIVEKAG